MSRSDILLVSLLENLQKAINDVKSQVDHLQSGNIALSPDPPSTTHLNENNSKAKPEPNPSPLSYFVPRSSRQDVITAVADGVSPRPRFAQRNDVSDLAFPRRTVSRRQSVSEPANRLTQYDNIGFPTKKSMSMSNLLETNDEASGQFPPQWLFRHLLDMNIKRRTQDAPNYNQKMAQASQEGWPKMWSRFRSTDEAKVKDYKEDIDTLLVFAGLFSAIVTAFVVAFYVTLQPNSGDITTFILFQISSQLQTAFPVNGTSLDESQLSIPSFPFQSPGLAIRVNTLWFISLTFALATASFGILVKQWLREYMAMDDMSAAQQCRIRHLRDVYMYRWRVFEIAAFLPLLLQASVILFLIGLSDFVRSLNPVVGWVTTSFIIVYFVLLAGSLLLPVISVHCPYKTPFLKTILQFPRYLYLKLVCTLTSYQYQLNNSWAGRSLWKAAALRCLRFIGIRLDQREPPPFETMWLFRRHGYSAFERALRDDRRLDIPLVVSADGTFLDRDLQSTYRSRLSELSWRDLQCSMLFSPAYTACSAIDTAKGFQDLMNDAGAHPLVSRSIIADIMNTSMIFPDNDYGSNQRRGYLDAAAYWLLYDSFDSNHQVLDDASSRLQDLVANSDLCASYVLQYLADDSLESRPEMYWYGEGVANLVRAGVIAVADSLTTWRHIGIVEVLSRAILCLDVPSRRNVEEKFTEFLTAIHAELESGQIWNNLAVFERQSTKKRALACLQHFRDLNADINGFVPNNVVLAMRNFTLMKEEENSG